MSLLVLWCPFRLHREKVDKAVTSLSHSVLKYIEAISVAWLGPAPKIDFGLDEQKQEESRLLSLGCLLWQCTKIPHE